MKVTNISKGPRGFNSTTGPVLVEVGATVEAEVTEAEYKVSKATGWFELDGKPVQDEKK